MRRPLMAAIAALALLTAVTACGDDGGSVFEGSSTAAPESTTTTAVPTTTTASTTITASTTTVGGGNTAIGGLVAGALAEGSGADAPVTTSEEEQCLTSGLAQAIGAERFAELDALAVGAADVSVVFGQMTDPELDALIEVIGTCIDVEAMLTAEMTGDELSPEAVACFAGSLSQEDTLKSLIKAMITGEDPATNPEFMAIVIPIMTQDCVEPLEAMLIEEFLAGGMSEAGAACVADKFLRGGLFEALLNTMLSGTDFPTDPELQNQMMSAFAECLTPEELGNLGG
jgi:predicted small lipoprotein YifL